MATEPATIRRHWSAASGWWVIALALLALRLPHLRGPLTDPHSWRACDTVHTSLDFYRRGLDLLHPAVCWLGAHRTLVLNFPLSEALSSLLYRAFGPDPMWDRVVSLFFFVISTLYLFGVARLVAGQRVARLTTLAYLAVPLGQYFSRVPHIEFGVIAFVNGTFYHALRAAEEKSWGQAIRASACGVFAALIKAPYLGTIVLPLALVALSAPALATFLRMAVAFGGPAVAFLLWRNHVDAVNARVPDWSFMPGFYKEVNPLWRYIGTLTDRLQLAGWIKIERRLIFEVASPIGALLGLGALARVPRAAGGPTPQFRLDPRWIALAWFGGCVVYMLVFFPLNVEHNYYQLPFLAPTALLVGLGTDGLWERLPRLGPARMAAVIFAAFLATAVWWPARLGYDRVDWLRIEGGRVIASRVPEGELLVAADFGTKPPIDPRLLFRSGREGWPMRASDMTPDRLAKLRAYGARWVAVLTDPGHPEIHPPAFLEPARVATLPVTHEGRPMGIVHIFDLRRPFDGVGAMPQ